MIKIMKQLEVFSMAMFIWQIVMILGFITLIYLAVKLYIRYMKYLQVKNKVSRTKNGIR